MDPVSAIVGALVAGATAAASGVASDALKDAYQGLKAVLTDGYRLLSTPLLEKRPSSTAYQEAVHDELRENPAIVTDSDVLEQVKKLQDALQEAPPAQLASWGIDIGRLEVDQSVILEGIRGRIRGDDWRIRGDFKVSGGNT